MQYHLRRMVTLGFQEQRVHIRMTGNTSSLSLYCLSAPYLQTLWGGIAVERHVLGFERGRLIAVLQEDATESRRNDALTDIAACSCQHQGV